MDNIGENIRKIRILLDIKQAVMAKMLNLSVNFYGKIERNEVEVKPERLIQIAKIFEMVNDKDGAYGFKKLFSFSIRGLRY